MEAEHIKEKRRRIIETVIGTATQINEIASTPIGNSSLFKKRIFRHNSNNHRKIRLMKKKAREEQTIKGVRAVLSGYFAAMDIAIIASARTPKYLPGSSNGGIIGERMNFYIGEHQG